MRTRRTLATIACLVATWAVAAPALAHDGGRAGRAVPLGTGLQLVGVDPGTGTAYTSSDEGTVSVVDVAHCNARRRSRCGGPIASIDGPRDALGVAIYRSTLYVTSGLDGDHGAVSVYDLTHCHTGDVTGCQGAVATIAVPDIPLGGAIDASTGTLYVGNVADHIELIDLRSCRSGTLSGCGTGVSVPESDGPGFPLVDAVTHTLYLAANGPGANGSGDHVLVLDTRHCKAGDTTGCGADPGRLSAGTGPVDGLLDAATRTLYIANQTSHDVSVLNVTHCTGTDHSGCHQPATAVPVGAGPVGGMVETKDGRVLVGNQESDTISVIATSRCRATDTAGCPTDPPPTIRTGGAPFWLAYDASTGTVFTADHADKALGIIDAGGCRNGGHGCRWLAPSLPGGQQAFADDVVHTWFGSDGSGKLTLTDTRTCTARSAVRCVPAAIHTTQDWDGFVHPVVDDATHTLYLLLNDPDTFAGSLVAIDLRTCNARNHSDCAPVAPAMQLPNFAAMLSIDPRTHTIYETTQDDNTVQVIDGADCNAVRHVNCSAPVAQLPLAGRVFGLIADPVSNTVYVNDFGDDFDENTVYAIDSSHCRARDVSGCGHTPTSFTTGRAPLGSAIDQPTHSLFVLNAEGSADGTDGPGAVAIYDTRNCNAHKSTGCARSVINLETGRNPFLGAIDPVTRRLYVSDFEHAAVSVIDLRTCNAEQTRGCRDLQINVGDGPGSIGIDPETHSAFVQTGFYDTTYYFDTRTPGRCAAGSMPVRAARAARASADGSARRRAVAGAARRPGRDANGTAALRSVVRARG